MPNGLHALSLYLVFGSVVGMALVVGAFLLLDVGRRIVRWHLLGTHWSQRAARELMRDARRKAAP